MTQKPHSKTPAIIAMIIGILTLISAIYLIFTDGFEVISMIICGIWLIAVSIIMFVRPLRSYGWLWAAPIWLGTVIDDFFEEMNTGLLISRLIVCIALTLLFVWLTVRKNISKKENVSNQGEQ